MIDQRYLDTAHFLRRAGFGGTPQQIRAIVSEGLPATTSKWLQPDPAPEVNSDTDPVFIRLQKMLPDDKKDRLPVQLVKMWWIHRMLFTPNPLVEKMTLFWHGHFTSKLGGQDGLDMLRQNQLFRVHALGNFRTLTQAVSEDPAMLRYLNGNQNFKAHPNENYARELMELFTCGIGHYTEDDVKAAARAFSGWNLRQDSFAFNPRQHDDDPKTFLGVTGNWNGNDIVDKLVAHPATARRLCTQLFVFFGYDDPEPEVIDSLVKTYYETGYELGAVVGKILKSRAFYSEKARNALIKCPVQYAVGSVYSLGQQEGFNLMRPSAGKIPPRMGANAGKPMAKYLANADIESGLLAAMAVGLRGMGQDLMAPPSVKGWDGGEAWINSATMQNRITYAERLSRMPGIYREHVPAAAARARSEQRPFAEAWVDYLCEALGPLTLTPDARRTIVEYVAGAAADAVDPEALAADADQGPEGNNSATPPLGNGRARANRRAWYGRLQGSIPLMMATAEYQVY